MGAQTPFVQLSHPSLLLQLRPGSSQSGCHCPTPSSGDCALLGPLTGLLIPRPSERLAILALPPMPPGRARCPLCTCTEPSSPVGLPTPSPKLLPTGSCDCDCRRLSPLPPLRGLCHLSGGSVTQSGAPEGPMDRAGKKPGDLLQPHPQTAGDPGELCHLWPQIPHPMAFCGACGESLLSLPPSLQAWGMPSQHPFFLFCRPPPLDRQGAQRACWPSSLSAPLCPAPDMRHLD